MAHREWTNGIRPDNSGFVPGPVPNGRPYRLLRPSLSRLSSRPLAAALGILSMLAAPAAHGQSEPAYPPIVDRNFSIDLFEQPALGSPRLIAMSGAINSVAEGAAGLFTNPASVLAWVR